MPGIERVHKTIRTERAECPECGGLDGDHDDDCDENN